MSILPLGRIPAGESPARMRRQETTDHLAAIMLILESDRSGVSAQAIATAIKTTRQIVNRRLSVLRAAGTAYGELRHTADSRGFGACYWRLGKDPISACERDPALGRVPVRITVKEWAGCPGRDPFVAALFGEPEQRA